MKRFSQIIVGSANDLVNVLRQLWLQLGSVTSNSRIRKVFSWLPAVAWAGLIFFISNQPKEAFEQLGLSGQFLSVAGHLVVYFVLMLLLVLALRYSSNLPPNRVYLAAFIILAVYALSDEYHQSFVPGRTATIVDLFIDLIGAGLAWIAMVRWEQRRGVLNP